MQTNFNLNQFIQTYVTQRDESLLKSDFQKYQSELNNRINNKKVLVIGGAGTIGSSYIKAILKFKITKLVVVDINENGLTELVRDLRSSTGYNIPDNFITYPVNFGDRVFEKLFRFHGPFDIVANFAAHKHVRSEKDIFSIEAMVENNVLRARKLLDLLLEFPPEHFFCVSTDKAANPVNIMGASKKLMEELIMAYSDRLPIKTARFANVAFSNGSLPLGFLDRLNKQQPWACPLGIRRFFVSPQESGELCLMASIMGESGDIFYPKLDEEKDMIPFDQIAIDLLNNLGLKPDICKTEEEARRKALMLDENSTTYPIYFFGSDTSGEKTFEEFYTEKEELDTESFINLGVIKNSVKRDIKEIDSIFDKLNDLFENKEVTKSKIVDILKSYLPNFAHIETGKGLDSKM
ncbi:polysaccharide biosynthesis protein [Prolixibacter sp. SD074]|uniref:polysaccharide biosynthesis protein n=1 Tax=Prolixibacter sp. SD074 TaxID=2652391 RepID=UPI00128A4F58|nr:polysaccharide biosynthesis protein [Prolixibacter sp. SD074]GET29341.1 nucleoside-diphosphate sugar epimerase [Prolixibacter sp. SD074]